MRFCWRYDLFWPFLRQPIIDLKNNQVRFIFRRRVWSTVRLKLIKSLLIVLQNAQLEYFMHQSAFFDRNSPVGIFICVIFILMSFFFAHSWSSAGSDGRIRQLGVFVFVRGVISTRLTTRIYFHIQMKLVFTR